MARMNWDRVRREAGLARFGYSDWLDAAESRLWDFPDDTRPRRSKGRKPSKAERLRREAEALGISEEELKQRRREEARRDRLLAAEARRRGVTTKQLRRMVATGQVRLPGLPAPSGAVIVSSGRARVPTKRRSGRGQAPDARSSGRDRGARPA